MDNIKILGTRYHSKASEKYVDVIFKYGDGVLSFSVPIEYRRTGIDIKDDEIAEYLKKVYEEVNPKNWRNWKLEQKDFWKTKPKATTTKKFFDALQRDFQWKCVSCSFPNNPNWARRIQDIKEFGYTLSTDTNRMCPKCKKKTTHIMLLPIKRGEATGYEKWSPELKRKIIKILNYYDVFEAKPTKTDSLQPEHKFPEIRWDSDTRRENIEHLSPDEIKKDFQLMSNQRNHQKREVCRTCYQTGERGTIYGIEYYFKGGKIWDKSIPRVGKSAEKGCIGCPWHDIEAWRKSLQSFIKRT